MTLDEYLKGSGRGEPRAMARHLNVKESTVYRWRKRISFPSPKAIIMIDTYTHGAVAPSDWYQTCESGDQS
jgi:DNA-binding transcriptional regulator YdaS (Cro superfamily)